MKDANVYTDPFETTGTGGVKVFVAKKARMSHTSIVAYGSRL